MFRALRGLLIFFFVIVLLLSGLYFWLRTSLPRYRGALELAGVAADVEVVRDEYGVPRISGSSQEDVFFALGFVHAQDRLWQMESERLRAAGRFAQVLGERELANDRMMRTLGLYQAAQRDLEALTPRAHGVVQAYSDGINAFLGQNGGALPLEFLLLGHQPEAWSAVDVLARAKSFAWQQAGGWRDELVWTGLIVESGEMAAGEMLPAGSDEKSVPKDVRSRYRRLPLQTLLARFGQQSTRSEGSRAWAVTGPNSTGGALMAQELHGPLQAPSPYYLVQISAPGLEVAGATLPGMPVVLSGRNRQVGWAMVGAGVDSQDLYLERLNANRYLAPEGWRDLELRSETIRVRGGDDLELTVRATRHGPLVSDLLADRGNDGSDLEAEGELHALALAWASLREPDRSLQGLLDLLFATDWGSFVDALRNVDLGGQVVLYGDAEGEIGLQMAARLPRRKAGHGRFPAPGWQERFDWDDLVPFRELPRTRSTKTGRIALAASSVAADGEAEQDTEGRDALAPSRHAQLLLADLSHHTPLSFERILADRHTPFAFELLPWLRSARPLTPMAARAQAELVGWDGSGRPGEAASVIFTAWYRVLATLIFGDEVSEELTEALVSRPELVVAVLNRAEHRCDDRRTEGREDCTDMASRALRDASASLAEQLGPDPREWNRIESAETHRHPFYSGSTLASLFDVRAPARKGQDGGFTSTPAGDRNGPLYRAVYDLGDQAGTRFLVSTGQSGNPLARGYRSMTEAWSQVRLLRLSSGEPGEGGSRLLLAPRR